MTRTLARCGFAVLSCIAIWMSFPPLGWWPAGVVGVAALTLVIKDTSSWRGAAAMGGLAGLGLWVPMLSFLRGYGIDAWMAVVIIESLWFVLLGLALRVALRARWWPLATALMWVGQEFLRDRLPFDGFPWGRLAFGQADGPLLRLASLGGAPLVTFAVALAGGAVAYLVTTIRLPGITGDSERPVVDGRATRGLIAAAGVAIIVAGPLAITLPTAGTSHGGAASSVVIAAVQGNVPRLGLDAFDQGRIVTANHTHETEVLAQRVAAGDLPRPSVVIWPEDADDLDPRTDAISRSQIDAAATAVGVPILVGAVINGPGPTHVQNAAIVWSPTTGPGQMYIKRHLVPFGEYLPFRSLLTKVSSKFLLITKDFVPGHRHGTMTIGSVKIADAICFEVADDTVVRQAVTGGGRILVVQTNNASYEHAGDSGTGGETAQQLAIARLRAVEHGRAVVVAATTGVSAMISPNGTVLARTKVFTPALLDMRLPLRDPITIADRVGPWPEWILSVGALLALAAGLVRRKAPEPTITLDVASRVIVEEPVQSV